MRTREKSTVLLCLLLVLCQPALVADGSTAEQLELRVIKKKLALAQSQLKKTVDRIAVLAAGMPRFEKQCQDVRAEVEAWHRRAGTHHKPTITIPDGIKRKQYFVDNCPEKLESMRRELKELERTRPGLERRCDELQQRQKELEDAIGKK